ncbi:MAG: hypothetical protein PVJ64_03550 [Gemmatimonadales bacterium]|jgi:hypothetical protein
MSRSRVVVALVLSAGLFIGCDDDGGPSLALADLVGSWIADEFEFTNQENPIESVDFIAAGLDVTMTISANGRYTIGAADPLGSGADFIKGALLVEEGFLLVTDDDEPGETIAFSVQLSGDGLTIFTDEVDYDFDVPPDGIDEPADLRAVFQLATGTTVADLVGTWEATEFRFVSSPTPTDTIDVIDLGGGLSVTLVADGRYDMTIELPGELPDDQSGVALVVGDIIVMIDEVAPEGSIRFEYGLAGETITLRGEDSIDFDDPPDGTNEAAVVEMVLERK